MKCGSCGAEIAADDRTCRFCGVLTQFAAHQQYQERQHQAHLQMLSQQTEQQNEAGRKQAALTSLHRTSNYSLYWGLLGLLLCCLFIPSVVAIVLGLRARKMASKYQLVLPVNATLGLALGIFGTLAGASCIVFAVVDHQNKAQRIAEIDRKLETNNRATLTPNVACLLAEKRLLKHGFGKSTTIKDPECIGKLTQTEEQATLEDIQFKVSGKRVSVQACLTYSDLWRVSSFRLDSQCPKAGDPELGESDQPTEN